MRSFFVHLTLYLFGLLPNFLHAYPYLYVGLQDNLDNLNAFDIANPAAPILVPYTSSSGVNNFSLAISPNGQVLYGSSSFTGLLAIYNLTNPKNPIFVQTVSGNTQPWGLLLHPGGQYLYLGDGTNYNMTIYNLTDQENPVPNIFSLTEKVNYFAVSPNADYLYAVGSSSNTLQTFDISNPANPVQQSSLPITSIYLAIHPTGDYLYVIDSNTPKLAVYSLAIPSSPQLLPPNLPLGTNPQMILISPSQKYLYVTNQGDSTLSIFNIENPSTPIPETTFAPAAFNSPAGLITSPNGSYLYVSNTTNNTISVVDISSEGSPIWIKNISTTRTPQSMAITPLFFKPFSRPMNQIH